MTRRKEIEGAVCDALTRLGYDLDESSWHRVVVSRCADELAEALPIRDHEPEPPVWDIVVTRSLSGEAAMMADAKLQVRARTRHDAITAAKAWCATHPDLAGLDLVWRNWPASFTCDPQVGPAMVDERYEVDLGFGGSWHIDATDRSLLGAGEP